MKRPTLIAFGLLLAATQAPASQPLEKIEVDAMRRLAKVQAGRAEPTLEFTSDGCSGGMSDGWKLAATLLPGFKTKLGDKPPWESCCVEHDRAYWRGRTQDGYRLRLEADERLKECVTGIGTERPRQLSAKLELPQETVEKAFKTAATSMFRAVRLGGGPCTGLPWRWGYGWPGCGK